MSTWKKRGCNSDILRISVALLASLRIQMTTLGLNERPEMYGSSWPSPRQAASAESTYARSGRRARHLPATEVVGPADELPPSASPSFAPSATATCLTASSVTCLWISTSTSCSSLPSAEADTQADREAVRGPARTEETRRGRR